MAATFDSSARRPRRVATAAVALVLVLALLAGTGSLSTSVAAQQDDADGQPPDEAVNETPADSPLPEDDSPPEDDVPLEDDDSPPDDLPPDEQPAEPPLDDEPAPSAGTPTEPPVQAPEGNVTVDVEDGTVPATGTETLTFEVDNDGDEEARDVVVTLQSFDRTLFFGSPSAPQQQRSVSLESLSSGESETVEVDVGAARVEPGSYPLFATVQYVEDDEDVDDGDEVARADGPTPVPVEVVEIRRFDAANVSESVPVDGDASYAVEITNEGDETVTGLVAVAEASPPLSSPSPTAYVGTLEPGESETVRFGLETESDAVETTTGLPVTLAYDTAAGERASADPIQVPVSVVEDDEGTEVESIAPIAAAVAVLALVAVWWWRRR
jgi:hypothetical protein